MDLLLYKLHYPLHLSDKQDSNLHHRPPRERTSPFGHYLHCTSLNCSPFTLSIGLPVTLRVGSYYSYTHHYSLFIFRFLYILSSYATLFLFLLLFIVLFYLSLLYLYHYISYTSILVIFTFSYISILYYPYHSLCSSYTTLSTFAEILNVPLLCIIIKRLSITYLIFIEFIWTEGVIVYLSTC